MDIAQLEAEQARRRRVVEVFARDADWCHPTNRGLSRLVMSLIDHGVDYGVIYEALDAFSAEVAE